MKKVLSVTLASLALSALSSSAYAQFGASVRGDVGMLGNQVPYFMVQTGLASSSGADVNTATFLSHRKEGLWDFTGRIFVYTSCAPCATYVAASWQGSNHKVHSCHEITQDYIAGVQGIMPLRIVNPHNDIVYSIITGIANDVPVSSRVEVKNKFSKAKLGFGIDLIKNCCFSLTMEMGGNYLDAHLDTNIKYDVTQTVAAEAGCITIPPGNTICSGPDLPFDFIVRDETCQKTEGVGLYASFRADYKFPANCLGNCFGIYGKAEVADIIGRQKYSDKICYENGFDGDIVITPPDLFIYKEHVCNRYNNVVEVDLEAALTYTPCFKCWDDLKLYFALGVRADSFVNLFSKPIEYTDVSFLSLTRPTVFLEVGIKV